MNVLAIGAHPDDIEICCGGTLAKYASQGHRIYMALSTNGNQGSFTLGREEIAAVRREEAEEAAAVLGADIRFMDFDDQGLIDSAEVRRSFINAIRWANPDVILTHYPQDNSTDHALTGKLATRVLLSLQSSNIPADVSPIQKLPILFYFDTGAGVGFIPEVYVDISAEIGTKKKAYGKHVSQLEWMKAYGIADFAQYVDVFSGFRGLQAGVRYAEGFIGCKLWSYMPDYKLLP
jgi:LmbE family N-acetylglucosaminyl deacetylase